MMDRFSEHEVYDRASVMLDTWASFVMEHEVVARDPELFTRAERALEAMAEFYQFAAGKFSKQPENT